MILDMSLKVCGSTEMFVVQSSQVITQQVRTRLSLCLASLVTIRPGILFSWHTVGDGWATLMVGQMPTSAQPQLCLCHQSFITMDTNMINQLSKYCCSLRQLQFKYFCIALVKITVYQSCMQQCAGVLLQYNNHQLSS